MEVQTRQSITLVHAVDVARQPIADAFKRNWPQAHIEHLMDDGLGAALERAGKLTDAIQSRIDRLADHGVANGANAILFTCSSFGGAIDQVAERLHIPVLKPNEAMYRQALQCGGRLGLLATFAPAIAPMEAEFAAMVAESNMSSTLDAVFVPGALDALRGGDCARHDQLIAAAAVSLKHCDAIMLAQFSMASAQAVAHAATGVPVLTSPDAAVHALRQALTSDSSLKSGINTAT